MILRVSSKDYPNIHPSQLQTPYKSEIIYRYIYIYIFVFHFKM